MLKQKFEYPLNYFVVQRDTLTLLDPDMRRVSYWGLTGVTSTDILKPNPLIYPCVFTEYKSAALNFKKALYIMKWTHMMVPSPNYLLKISCIIYSFILRWNTISADLEKYSFLKSQLVIHGVVPEVLHEAPPHVIQISYRKKPVETGNMMSPPHVNFPPTEISYPAHEKGIYALVLIDPDSPNRTHPVDREFKHWVVGNIPGVGVSRGSTVYSYWPPKPVENSGVHRYVFIVFQQPNGTINYTDELPPKDGPVDYGRKKFNTMEFARYYGLGDAIAVNFFRMEWDSSYENPSIHL